MNVGERRARQQSALRARVLGADAVVIRVEQHAKGGIERAIPGEVRLEHEGLEEPAGVRQVPLHRTRVGHRLDRAIFRRQRGGQRERRRAEGAEARRQRRDARLFGRCDLQWQAVVHRSGSAAAWSVSRHARRPASRARSGGWNSASMRVHGLRRAATRGAGSRLQRQPPPWVSGVRRTAASSGAFMASESGCGPTLCLVSSAGGPIDARRHARGRQCSVPAALRPDAKNPIASS